LIKNALAMAAATMTPMATAILLPATAQAHGYISTPVSRQAQCAQGVVPCGDIKYEPQSVEGPKGQRNCSAGKAEWAELDDDSKGWQVNQVASSTVNFTWTNTAVHATDSWEYFIGSTRVGYVDGNSERPPMSVTHPVDLSGFSGRQRLIAIWTIADTDNAFYSCVDLQIGGGTPTTTTQPTTTTPTTTPPSTTMSPTTTSTPPSSEWRQGATYDTGDVVTYDGTRYRCLQAHTAQDPSWTPPNTPALWEPA
jgi:predicted carbohydrate-binding protein with CBM5 and CBM33 domain